MVDLNYVAPKETVLILKKYALDSNCKILDAGCGTGLVGIELKKYALDNKCKILDAGCGTGLVGIELKKCGYSNIEGVDFSQNMLDLIPKSIYKKIEKVDLNKPLKFKTNMYDVVMCVGTFTYGHVKPKALNELIRITKNKGIICFTINEGIYEKYGFDNKIKELSNNKLWNVKEFFKSDYIVNKDVNAWLCLSEITK